MKSKIWAQINPAVGAPLTPINKQENDYRVYWSPGVKWPLPTCVMSDKG